MQHEKRDSALAAAHRVQVDAARVGFDWPTASGPMEKVKEELEELQRESGAGSREAIEGELGDLLFAVVNLARKLGINPDRALRRANQKFTGRFGGVRKLANKRGLAMGKASLEELDQLWNEVKKA